ncbi:hypothetical protein AVEN_114691-1 [Araneus ventricosus]|uniref:Uncharacterized protein n=1 Tax=Araneus ventricosus TaxID=182803 RepID=A0A4Y2MR73_ARAVE|nr:hypothetical protein AVEN_114691-1 [Araneus ventricosus]
MKSTGGDFKSRPGDRVIRLASPLHRNGGKARKQLPCGGNGDGLTENIVGVGIQICFKKENGSTRFLHLVRQGYRPYKTLLVWRQTSECSIGPHRRTFRSAVEIVCEPSPGTSEIRTAQGLVNTVSGVILTRHNLLTCLLGHFNFGHKWCCVVRSQNRLVRKQNWTCEPSQSFDYQCVAQIDSMLLVAITIDNLLDFSEAHDTPHPPDPTRYAEFSSSHSRFLNLLNQHSHVSCDGACPPQTSRSMR